MMHKLATTTALLFCLIVLLMSNPVMAQTSGQGRIHVSKADQGMVVCESGIASRVGRDVIAKGGNAVDGAVATAFALAVTWPEAGNIGGGGFMMICPADGKDPVCIDYRETAPQAARVDTFKKNDPRYDRKIVGVPGTVRGLWVAHQKYGKLPWKDLVMPAAKIAREGFSVDYFLAESTNGVLDKTKGDPLHEELHRVYGTKSGAPWKAGDVMVLPDLAKTLTEIAEDGADAFYQGAAGKLLLQEMAKGRGLIRKVDLDGYRAKIRKPIVGQFNGYQVIGAPPPSSGGTCIVQALNMVEALDMPKKDRFKAKTIHLLAEISRRAFLDRARHLGDPDFVEIPQKLISKEYAKELAAEIDLEKATQSESLGADIKLADESESTTHFSVVDGDGMAVSNTYTLEASWGNRMVVPGAGYVLNNEMGDFNWVKGLTDRRGRIGTDANLIEPGKRMLSSQCPVIVTRDGKPVLVTGSPGGRTIINTVFGIVLNVTHFEMPVTEAVQASRFHHQWLPDQLALEDVDAAPHKDAKQALETMGHKVVNRVSQGSAHTIMVDHENKSLIGVSDYRRGGRPAGFASDRIACWDFGGTRGTKLHELIPIGSPTKRWSKMGIVGSALDGEDCFRINRDSSEKSFGSYFCFDQAQPKISATIDIEQMALMGERMNEIFQFEFTRDDGGAPGITARMQLKRTEANHIVIRGSAMGGGTEIPAVTISESNKIDRPLSIRLSVDVPAGRYSISTRRSTEIDYKEIGVGKIGGGLKVGCMKMSALNNFNNEGEYLLIDRIDVVKD